MHLVEISPAIIPYHKISFNRLLSPAILTFVLQHVSTAGAHPQSRTASAKTGGANGQAGEVLRELFSCMSPNSAQNHAEITTAILSPLCYAQDPLNLRRIQPTRDASTTLSSCRGLRLLRNS
jgi:hypothetical protein